MTRLLLLSCSQRKRPDPGLLPAIERYDGPAFRVLRRYLRQAPTDLPTTLVLSAEYGLISAETPIPDYDRRMTTKQANALAPRASEVLDHLLQTSQCLASGPSQAFVCMGKSYLQALRLSQPNWQPTVAIGPSGARLAQLRKWLYGGTETGTPQPIRGRASHKTSIKGVKLNLAVEDVIEVARRALNQQIGEPDHWYSWYVAIDDQKVAPKWLVSLLSGLPASAFHTADAVRVLRQLGIDVRLG